MLIAKSAAHASSCISPPVRLQHLSCNTTDAHSACGSLVCACSHASRPHLVDLVHQLTLYKWACTQGASEKIKAKSSHHRTSAVFHAWRTAVTEGRRASLKMQQVISRMSNMRLSQAFGVWQVRVDEETAKKQQLNKAVVRLQRLRCSAVLFGWFRLTQQTQATQGRLLKAVR